MRKILALLFVTACSIPALGQTTGMVMVVTSCGSVSPLQPNPFIAGRQGPLTIDVNGVLCATGGGGGGGGGTSSNFGQAFPSTGTAAGFSDGTNMQGARVYDTDSGAGTQYTLGVNLRIAGSGGSVEGGTSSNPIRVDPTGSTTQPVSGTVTANQGGAWSVNQGGTWSVNQGGTWTVQPGNTANSTPWLMTVSQGGNAATVSGAGALKVDGSAATQPVSGTVTANQGGAPWTMTGTGSAGSAAAGVLTVQGISSMTPVQVSQSSAANLNATVVGTGTFAVQAAQSGTWTVQPGNAANTTPWLVTSSPSSGSSAAVTSASSTSAGSNLVVKSGAGNLYHLTVSIGATSGYLMLFDATALPSNGAVTPSYCLPVTSNGTNGGAAIEFATPKRFGTGITAGFSTTGCFTLTASTTASFFAGYQ